MALKAKHPGAGQGGQLEGQAAQQQCFAVCVSVCVCVCARAVWGSEKYRLTVGRV